MRRSLLLLTLLSLAATACIVDEYWVDELVVVLDEPVDRALVYSDRGLNGNVTGLPICTPQRLARQAYLESSGEHVLEIHTEDEFERTALTVAAWSDADGDDEPGCEELGTRFGVSMEITSEVSVEEAELEVGGGSAEPCDQEE